MAILLSASSRVLVQGITGRIGQFHTQEMLAYGTTVVGGVTPGRGGSTVLGVPVFNTVKDAVTATRADTSIVFVPPPFAADAIMEAADAGIRYCVCITGHVPIQDMMRVKRYMRRYRATRRMVLSGPNCAGTISPGRAMLGIMPAHVHTPGRVGVVSRSGALGYEAAAQLGGLGMGVSTSVGIGRAPITGSSFPDHLSLFEDDPDTDAVLMIGERGGAHEATAAAFVRRHMTTPVVAYLAGLSVPDGCRMGRAGASVAAGESAREKLDLLADAGVTTVLDPSGMGAAVATVLRARGLPAVSA
jgi:malate-CoA ligase subunit alpha